MTLNTTIMLCQPWVNGEEQTTSQDFNVHNPATGELVARVGDSDVSHAQKAIDSASAQLPLWRSTPANERAQYLEQWANEIESHITDLAVILSSESGKCIGEAEGEIHHSVDALRWSAQSSLRLHGETLASPSTTQRNYTIKEAVGVVACITPWNFPVASILVKVSAAIAAGCTVIVKPSEETPLIALALAGLSHKARMPAGVLHILPSNNPASIANELTGHPAIKMISFTGSTAVGKQLYASCGQSIKRVALELGGNAPFIVFDDADINKAVDDAINARFYNSGQICVGANRFFIHESIYHDFSTALANKVAKLTVGNPLEKTTNIGPMINQKAKHRLTQLVDDAKTHGAQVITPARALDESSSFFAPTVLTHTTKAMRVYSEEIFGPIACLYSFTNESDVIESANDTQAGLAAYVYSQNIARLIRMSEQLEAGVVGANSTNIFSNNLPFGGIKQSGLGKEHGLGCLDEYVQTKSVCLNLND